MTTHSCTEPPWTREQLIAMMAKLGTKWGHGLTRWRWTNDGRVLLADCERCGGKDFAILGRDGKATFTPFALRLRSFQRQAARLSSTAAKDLDYHEEATNPLLWPCNCDLHGTKLELSSR